MKKKVLTAAALLIAVCFTTKESSAECIPDIAGGCVCYAQVDATGSVMGYLCAIPGIQIGGLTCVCPEPL